MTDPLKACQARVAELERNAKAVARAHMDQVAALSERVASLDTALDASKEAHFREQDEARKLVAENKRLMEALEQARDGAFEKIGSTELIRGLLRLLQDGYGPGGGYYEPDQRVPAAVSLLKIGWGSDV